MHELVLMDNVLNMVGNSARARGIRRVKSVKLVVGEASMVLPDSLSFAFEALAQDELFKEAELEMEIRPLHCWCLNCEQSFGPSSHYDLNCPYCEEYAVEIRGGQELYVDYYEGDE